MISKELLIEVLGIEVEKVSINGKVINYTVPNYEAEEDGEIIFIDLGMGINIYELAHKCKEWAFKLDYILESAFIPISGTFTASYCKIEKQFACQNNKKTFHGDTETEAIFKACEWILNKERENDK